MNDEKTEKQACLDCGDLHEFLPYWENTPVCYACYFRRVGDFKVDAQSQISSLSAEVERLNNTDGLDEIMQRFSQYRDEVNLRFDHLRPFEAMNAGARLEELIKSAYVAGKRKSNKALRCKIDQMREAIEKAPHPYDCAKWSHHWREGWEFDDSKTCNCWKSQANKQGGE